MVVGCHEITGADVAEVLDWARAHTADEHVFTLYAVYNDRTEGLHLIRLAGIDPTDPDVVLRLTE